MTTSSAHATRQMFEIARPAGVLLLVQIVLGADLLRIAAVSLPGMSRCPGAAWLCSTMHRCLKTLCIRLLLAAPMTLSDWLCCQVSSGIVGLSRGSSGAVSMDLMHLSPGENFLWVRSCPRSPLCERSKSLVGRSPWRRVLKVMPLDFFHGTCSC